MYCVQGSSVLSICVKPGISATHWTMTDLVPAGLLVYWTVTDLVPAHLVVFNTGELTQVETLAGKVGTLPPQVLDICPPGLVMDPNWEIHYKVVLTVGGNSLVLASEREWDFGGILFFGEIS